MEDGDEKRKAVLKLVRGLVRLRKSDRECEQGQREAAQAERAAEVHEDWAARMRPKSRADASGEMSDVRRKMTEVIARMSDEQIAESLQRSGYLPAAELQEKRRVWWTEEDEALEGDDDEDEQEDGWDEDEEEDESEDRGRRTEDGEATRTASTSTSASMSTSVDAASNAEVPRPSGREAPPTVRTEQAGAAGSGDPGPTTGGLTRP